MFCIVAISKSSLEEWWHVIPDNENIGFREITPHNFLHDRIGKSLLEQVGTTEHGKLLIPILIGKPTVVGMSVTIFRHWQMTV
jgi:hypothetical protein